MFSRLRSLFGSRSETDYTSLMQRGAIILDVRTKGEYQSGNVKGSLNIPIKELKENISKLPKNKPIITVCASGVRSAAACEILQSNGFNEVYNGGSWNNLKDYGR